MTDISQGSDNTLPPAPPPVTEADIKAAVALAPTLDPSMAGAIYAGNTAIIAAIAQGANTDDDIAEQLINMGITTGLPPGIQQIIDQQLEEMNAKREAGNGKLLGAGEAVLAAAVGEHWSMDVPGEGGEEKPSWHGKDIDEMDFGQKLDYLNALEDMSFAQYAALSDAERKKNNENVTKDAQSKLDAAEHDKAAFEEKMKTDPSLGNTPEERAANRAKIDAATNINLTGDEAKAAIEALPPELQAAAEEQRRILRNEYYSKMALEAAEAERKALERGDIEAAHRYAQDAAGYMRADHEKDLKASTEGLKQEATHQAGAPSARTLDLATRSDSSMLKASLNPTVNDAQLRETRDDNISARMSADVRIVQADKNATLSDGLGDEPAMAPAPAAPRLTINALPLAAAGLDKLGTAPELVANDIAPERKPEAPKVAQISSPGSMGA